MSLMPNYPLLVIAGLLIGLLAALLFVVKRDKASVMRKLAIAVLLAIVAMRPTIGETEFVTYSAGVDVVIMVDRTTSMAAEDWNGNHPRLDGVKADMKQVISQLTGSRFAIVVFDNNARIALPFTTDANAAISMIDAIGWRETTYGTGSDISIAIPQAEKLLEESEKENSQVGRYLIYISDGEQTAQAVPQSFAPLAHYLKGGMVLGYGTVRGGHMKQRVGSDKYVEYNGQLATSIYNEQNLRNIANQLDVPFYHRVDQSPLKLDVTGQILVPTVHKDPRGFELYWIAGLGIFILAVFEIFENITRFRIIKREMS